MCQNFALTHKPPLTHCLGSLAGKIQGSACVESQDLHGLDLSTESWFPVKTAGEQPPPRANHASAVDEFRLYIFGGWDGTKRLNDLYVLDTCDNVCLGKHQNLEIVRKEGKKRRKMRKMKISFFFADVDSIETRGARGGRC